jgi:putative transposase
MVKSDKTYTEEEQERIDAVNRYQRGERAKQGEQTLSTDEMTGVQALERKAPDLPLAPGKVQRREFEYIRHGTQALTVNLDVVTSQVVSPTCVQI